MITCRELAEQLLDFAAGQLPLGQQEHVEQHLRSCSSCAAYLESYQMTIHLSRQLPGPPLPPNLARQLRALLMSFDDQTR
jgi:anti-sigma factor RsiW